MEAFLHLLGFCSDGHFHLDLTDLFILGNTDFFWLWLRYWTGNLLLFIKNILWM